MMLQQHRQQAQTDQTLPAIHGCATLSTFAHQWVFLRPDTPSLDLQEEALQEEEVAADSQEEVTPEEAAADSQLEEDMPLNQEDHKETD